MSSYLVFRHQSRFETPSYLQQSSTTLMHNLQIRPYKCIYLKYQSLEDWSAGEDILRCNPDFHGESRSDTVLINAAGSQLECARLIWLLRCVLPSGHYHDVALVHYFNSSTWKPFTKWDGCRVYEEEKSFSFVLLKYLIRGAYMIPVFDGPNDHKKRYYMSDTVDNDMFLRVGN